MARGALVEQMYVLDSARAARDEASRGEKKGAGKATAASAAPRSLSLHHHFTSPLDASQRARVSLERAREGSCAAAKPAPPRLEVPEGARDVAQVRGHLSTLQSSPD